MKGLERNFKRFPHSLRKPGKPACHCSSTVHQNSHWPMSASDKRTFEVRRHVSEVPQGLGVDPKATSGVYSSAKSGYSIVPL